MSVSFEQWKNPTVTLLGHYRAMRFLFLVTPKNIMLIQFTENIHYSSCSAWQFKEYNSILRSEEIVTQERLLVLECAHVRVPRYVGYKQQFVKYCITRVSRRSVTHNIASTWWSYGAAIGDHWIVLFSNTWACYIFTDKTCCTYSVLTNSSRNSFPRCLHAIKWFIKAHTQAQSCLANLTSWYLRKGS